METQKPESKNMFVYLDDDGWFEPNDLASSDAISPLRAALREQLRGEAQEVQEPSVRSLLRPVAAGPENRAEILERAPAEAEETRGLREQVLQEQLAAAAAAAAAQDAERTALLGQVAARGKRGEWASDASSPPEHRAEPPAALPTIPHSLLLALSCLDDAGLRREFDKHADCAAGADGEGERRMSTAGLASLMRAKELAHGNAEVRRVLERVDANGDGWIDFGEFCALARANSDLEKVLRSKHLECVLASVFPRGTTLQDLSAYNREQMSAIVDLSKPAMVQLLVDLAAQMAAVGTAQHAAGGGKFTGELKGGPLQDFYEGVTGVCGTPDADIEKGMREEHTEREDSQVEFSTPNYGLTTTPAKEWALVLEGGSGCAKVEGKEGSVSVPSTQGCCKASGLKWLNTGNVHPTWTLGLRWLAVGDTQPTEGRQLTNSLLADALNDFDVISDEKQHKLDEGFKSLKAHVKARTREVKVFFTKKEWDVFGITDLRNTDFIEAGSSYFKPIASTAQLLENARLEDALMQKTEFTLQEWDAFGVHGLRMNHFVKSGDSFFQPAGTEAQADVRVLRPIAHYGDFGEDGRLKWGVGDEVVVGEALTMLQPRCPNDKTPEKKEIEKNKEGKVLEFNAEGAARIAFREPVSAEGWVSPDQFYRMYPHPSARDTPIQRMVKLGRLRRCEVFALVLYTGPMYVLLNGILRDFGFCGAVAPGTEFASDEFWTQWKEKDIKAWVEHSGHKFTNTIHALASAIKKLQVLAAQEPSIRLYRGLGGLDVAKFAASLGFTDRAFMSMTKDRSIALEYSGVHKGLVGTALCIETSTTNNGAVLLGYSQYPEEEETVWNACSFVQHLPGREEVVLMPEGGVVRIYHVLVSANSRAETVEELEGRRKRVVVQVLDCLHTDVCRAVDAAVKTEEFEKRLAQDQDPGYGDDQWARFRLEWRDGFIRSIKDESAERVAVYKALPDAAYAEIEMVGQAVSKGLALPLLARAKLRLWLEDLSVNLITVGAKSYTNYLGLNAAQGLRLARRRLLLQDSSAGRHDSIDGVGRIVVEDGLERMGGTATAVLALEDCRERFLVTGTGATALERKDPFSGETPLISQVQLGEFENAKRLLQAGADANAATGGGERALLIAAKQGREDLVELLVGFHAEVDGSDATGKTALHWASQEGHHAAVRTLLALGAEIAAKDTVASTSLHIASGYGHLVVVRTLLEHGSDVEARTQYGKTALDVAKNDEVKAALRQHGAKNSLFYAAENGMLEVVANLIKEGAEVNEKNHLGRTPLDLAKNKEYYKEVKTVFCRHSILLAARFGKEELVAEHIAQGADLAARDKYGKIPFDYAKKDEVKTVFARHSLLAAAQFGKEELVAEHIAQGANLAARDGRGRTALVIACAHGHEKAATQLVAPTHAAGALDVVGGDGFSALLWAEERGWDGVAQSLRECGAAAARRPALALFRGEAGAVQVDVKERTVAFMGSFATVRSAPRCPLGGKGYYELEILKRDDVAPQYGLAGPCFARVLGASGEGLGDDAHSWAVDGTRQRKWHNGEKEWECKWQDGDVIGFACDLDKMQMHVSLNGSFAAPHRVVFELAPDAVGDGLFAAFSGISGKVRYNLGEVPFRHSPPAADFQAYVGSEG